MNTFTFHQYLYLSLFHRYYSLQHAIWQSPCAWCSFFLFYIVWLAPQFHVLWSQNTGFADELWLRVKVARTSLKSYWSHINQTEVGKKLPKILYQAFWVQCTVLGMPTSQQIILTCVLFLIIIPCQSYIWPAVINLIQDSSWRTWAKNTSMGSGWWYNGMINKMWWNK